MIARFADPQLAIEMERDLCWRAVGDQKRKIGIPGAAHLVDMH
jgi:hypothetical protein